MHQNDISSYKAYFSVYTLKNDHSVFSVKYPEPENGDVDSDLDGGVQAAGLSVVEVPADARAKRGTHGLTQLHISTGRVEIGCVEKSM